MYHSPAIVVFTLIFLQTTHSRSHHRHHFQEENHHPRSNHRGESHHQEDSNLVRHQEEILALQHSELVAESGICNVPRPQVVQVSDHYPGRYFLPHCTVLHRCGRHSGCCGTDRLRCVPVHQEKVSLNFYSVRIGEGSMERRIEKLVFTNHTKCGCSPDHRVLSKNDL